jgi:hypothetical protein
MAVVIPFLTAVGYVVVSRHGVRLPAGFLWIGFPMEGNRLFRVGLFSIDSNDHSRHPRWSLSVDMRTSRRTIRIMLPVPVQYFDEYEMKVMPRDDIQANSDDVTPVTTTHDMAPAGNTQSATMTHTPDVMTPHQVEAGNASPNGSIRGNTDRKAIRLLL